MPTNTNTYNTYKHIQTGKSHIHAPSYLGEKHVGHGGAPHRRAGVAGHGLLNDVSRQDADGVYRLTYVNARVRKPWAVKKQKNTNKTTVNIKINIMITITITTVTTIVIIIQ